MPEEPKPIPGPILSIVVPVYNEEKVLHAFHAKASEALSIIEDRFAIEFVFVDDGSRDDSFRIMSELSKRDARIKPLKLSRNFGHQIAVTAGLDHAAGDIVVIIDADLQDPPEVILQMIEKWENGYAVVYGIRNRRKGESLFKLVTAKAFYRLIGKLSDTRMPLDTGDFRLMDREVVNALKSMREESRYIRGMVSWVGFHQCGVTYDRDPRYAGKTKYTLRKMLRFALNGITSFSEKPLILSGWIGLGVTMFGALLMLHILIGKLINPQSTVSGWASLMGVVIFFGGIQLLSLGILGQYVGRIYREVKRRPLYFLDPTVATPPKDRQTPKRAEQVRTPE